MATNPAENSEFDDQLRLLFAAIDKPLGDTKIEAFRLGLRNMSLPTLSRSVRLLIDELQQSEPPKNFSVSNIWAASKRLRAKAPEIPASTEEGDPWAEAGNRHLLTHFRRNPQRLKRYGEPASWQSMRRPESPPDWRGPDFGDASYGYIVNIKRIVRAKNAWVTDMKDLDKGQGVPQEMQKKIWDDYITRAEEEAT